MNEIGERIRSRRKELNITQTQIYKETGISSGNLSSIESGKILPSSMALIELSKVLDCSINWILMGNKIREDKTESHNMHEIYDRIMQEAHKHCLNGKEIGKMLGLKKSPLTDWKNGQSMPTTEQIILKLRKFRII